jgi:hypothetical protein
LNRAPYAKDQVFHNSTTLNANTTAVKMAFIHPHPPATCSLLPALFPVFVPLVPFPLPPEVLVESDTFGTAPLFAVLDSNLTHFKVPEPSSMPDTLARNP